MKKKMYIYYLNLNVSGLRHSQCLTTDATIAYVQDAKRTLSMDCP